MSTPIDQPSTSGALTCKIRLETAHGSVRESTGRRRSPSLDNGEIIRRDEIRARPADSSASLQDADDAVWPVWRAFGLPWIWSNGQSATDRRTELDRHQAQRSKIDLVGQIAVVNGSCFRYVDGKIAPNRASEIAPWPLPLPRRGAVSVALGFQSRGASLGMVGRTSTMRTVRPEAGGRGSRLNRDVGVLTVALLAMLMGFTGAAAWMGMSPAVAAGTGCVLASTSVWLVSRSCGNRAAALWVDRLPQVMAAARAQPPETDVAGERSPGRVENGLNQP
jgi:hypothetical protein